MSGFDEFMKFVSNMGDPNYWRHELDQFNIPSPDTTSPPLVRNETPAQKLYRMAMEKQAARGGASAPGSKAPMSPVQGAARKMATSSMPESSPPIWENSPTPTPRTFKPRNLVFNNDTGFSSSIPKQEVPGGAVPEEYSPVDNAPVLYKGPVDNAPVLYKGPVDNAPVLYKGAKVGIPLHGRSIPGVIKNPTTLDPDWRALLQRALERRELDQLPVEAEEAASMTPRGAGSHMAGYYPAMREALQGNWGNAAGYAGLGGAASYLASRPELRDAARFLTRGIPEIAELGGNALNFLGGVLPGYDIAQQGQEAISGRGNSNPAFNMLGGYLGGLASAGVAGATGEYLVPAALAARGANMFMDDARPRYSAVRNAYDAGGISSAINEANKQFPEGRFNAGIPGYLH